MSDNLTPYEQTYGAASGEQPPAGAPAPQPAAPAQQPPAPDPADRVQPAAEAPAASAQPASAAPQPSPAAPAKRKAWPWVVLGCALALLLVVGGCASCAAIATIAALDDYPDRHLYDGHGYHRDHLFGGYDDDPDYTYDDEDYLYDSDVLLTYDEVMEYLDLAPGTVRNGKACEGLYTVGGTGPDHIKPGLYYLEGSQTAVGEYLVFAPAAHPADGDLYRLTDAIVYMGNYFADLEEGEIMAFMPAKTGETMEAASKEPLDVKAPYQNGCYRVGIDLPAGTYVVTRDSSATAALVSVEATPAAIAMNDLDFDFSRGSDSIAEQVDLIGNGSRTITVKEGQYLELIGAQATPQG